MLILECTRKPRQINNKKSGKTNWKKHRLYTGKLCKWKPKWLKNI